MKNNLYCCKIIAHTRINYLTKMKMNKKRIRFLLCAAALFPLMTVAEEVEVLYMKTLTTDGKFFYNKLSEDGSTQNPVYYPSLQKLYAWPLRLAKSRVAALSFEMRTETIDAVKDIETGQPEADRQQAIYSLSGQRLPHTTTDNLPKGIYIINKKKVIIK